jgi:DNA helicase-4
MDKYLDTIFDKVDPTIKLDENQRGVVLDDSDNIIVVAGAGSGKTTTITAKVKYLVDIKKVKEEEILIISFTNKAINELQQRINIDFKINAKVCTFHKFAYDIIKGNDSKYRVLSDPEKIIKDIIIKDNETESLIKILLKNKKYKSKSKKYNSHLEYFIDFTSKNINLYKMSNIGQLKSKNRRIIEYLYYLDKVTIKYIKYLNKHYLLDFEDIIIEATKLVDNVRINYKYIIIDEYQDISSNRFDLISKIAKLYKVRTIVVGDDWQAIFSFAGSDINLFLDYKETMNASMHKIVDTYRNSQQLIDTAGNFIMNNKKQLEKKLVSNKTLDFPIEVHEYTNDIENLFIKVLEEIISIYGINKNILVLGRYNMDIKLVIGSSIYIDKSRIVYKKYPNLKIDFMTVHASNGLGYDNVIIINMINDIYGFPSKLEDDEIRSILINKEDNILEERRLFYVAITRTKNKVYLLTKKGKESEFIKEIITKDNVCYKRKKTKKR